MNSDDNDMIENGDLVSPDGDGDPFVTFTEWASEYDDEAYADL